MLSNVLQRFFRFIAICALGQTLSAQSPPSPHRIVLAASAVLDGQGHILRNTRIVVGDSKIIALDPNAAPVDYDLRGMTVLPGWIDAHVHLAFGFDKSGKALAIDPQEIALRTASNAWVTLHVRLHDSSSEYGLIRGGSLARCHRARPAPRSEDLNCSRAANWKRGKDWDSR